MGTRCAPIYAKMFMAEFKEKYIYSFIKQISMLFLRFIDDIFMVAIDEIGEWTQNLYERSQYKLSFYKIRF